MTQSPQPGEIRFENGRLIRFMEREIEGDKWEVLAVADADGWMPHDGGPNPVPGCDVQYRCADGSENYSSGRSSRWWRVAIAFRLAAPSVEREPKTASEIAFEAVTEGLTAPKPDVAGARERLLERLRAPSNWLQQPRGVDYKSVVNQYDRAPFEAADVIQRQAEEIERLRDKVEGLDSDLRSAVEVAYQRGAHEWASLNYPQWIVWLQRNAAARARQGGPDHG